MIKSTEELSPSELGTLDYWEKAYSLEIENFKDHGDVGEIWFGNNNSTKIVKFISTKLNVSKESDEIIDLGCGNGMILVDLAKAGFRNLTGVDYSQNAINLARKVVVENGFPAVKLQVCDVVKFTNIFEDESFPFKLAHDKGTYDAISLHPNNSRVKREKYIKNVHKILCNNGFLALTSCNWTKEELIKHFKYYFELIHELSVETFSYGGKTGNKITQLIFVKK